MTEKPVLYVEDDEDDAFFLQKAFLKVGISNPLLIVTDGQQAIDFLSGKGKYADRVACPLPCLILLDLNLPKKNGLEVLRWIRDQPAFSAIPVVILTASNQPADIHCACTLGANAYLLKPPAAEGLVGVARSISVFWLQHTQNPPSCLQFGEKYL
jgi:CheY-like chemotaxis protein